MNMYLGNYVNTSKRAYRQNLVYLSMRDIGTPAIVACALDCRMLPGASAAQTKKSVPLVQRL